MVWRGRSYKAPSLSCKPEKTRDDAGLPQIQRCDSLEDPGLISAWARLSETVPGSRLFSTHAWCAAGGRRWGAGSLPAYWWRAIRRENRWGLAPLCVGRDKGVRWLRFMGRERVSGDHLDLLVTPEHHEAFLRAMLRTSKVGRGSLTG